jgi:hypothetical protein
MQKTQLTDDVLEADLHQRIVVAFEPFLVLSVPAFVLPRKRMNLVVTRMDAGFWIFCVLLDSSHVFKQRGWVFIPH